MQLFVMRHGEAGWNAPVDAERSLTPAGTAAVRAMLLANVQQLAGVSAVVSSPYLRARQTAALVAEVLCVPILAPEVAFVPESSVADALTRLEQLPWPGVLMVAHQPLLGNLVATLLDGDARYAEPMAPGALVMLELEWPAPGMARLIKKLNA